MTDLLFKARSQAADGKYKAAVESLYAAVPAALGGAASEQRAVLELATTIHDRVDRRLQKDCEDIAASMSKALEATPGRGGTILIATFNETTGWVGKRITHDDEQFMLEDYGAITAADVMEYDRQGHLAWANDGTRAWVGSRALQPQAAPPTASQEIQGGPAAAGPSSEGTTVGKTAISTVGLLPERHANMSTSDLQVCGHCGATSLIRATQCGACGHELSRAHVYAFSSWLGRWFATVIDLLLASLPIVVVASPANASPDSAAGFYSLTFLVWLTYAVTCEAIWGRTVGKRLMRSRVLTVDEEAIGWGQSLVRNLFKIVGMLGILQLVTLVSILASKRSQRIGDMVAGTIVVTEDIGLLS